MILVGYLLTYSYLIIIIYISKILNEKYQVLNLYSRKFVHIFVSFVWFIFYIFFKETYHLLIPPITFIIINYYSYQKNLIKSIEDKESIGTILYPISVFIMALLVRNNIKLYPLFGIAFLSMGIGDGLAPIISRKYHSIKLINNKSLIGTLTVLIATIIITTTFNCYFDLNYSYPAILLVGLVSSLIELISIKGFDNLLMPLSIFLLLIILGG